MLIFYYPLHVSRKLFQCFPGSTTVTRQYFRNVTLPPPPPPPTPVLSMFFNAIPFEVTSRLRTNFSNDVFRLTKTM